MTREIYLDVIRLRRYGWRWGIVASIINRKYGTQYEARQLEIEFEIRQNRRKESHAESE